MLKFLEPIGTTYYHANRDLKFQGGHTYTYMPLTMNYELLTRNHLLNTNGLVYVTQNARGKYGRE